MLFLKEHPELTRRADSRNGMTPLHWASAFLLQSMATWVLDRKASTSNAPNRIGYTPLNVVGCGRGGASGFGRSGTAEQIAAMTELLLARGAERTARWALTPEIQNGCEPAAYRRYSGAAPLRRRGAAFTRGEI